MVEILESRIAPAAVYYYTDVDGDHVKIYSSKGTNAELAAAVTLSNASAAAVGKPHTLLNLNLNTATTPNPFSGAVISITATPSKDLGGTIAGQGIVNVGEIDAHTIDLASVTVHGDLGQILVGSGVGTQVGLGSLSVLSMGQYGTATGAATLNSRFENGAGSISIAHDADGILLRAFLPMTPVTHETASFGSVSIGGNLVGGSSTDTGEITSATSIGKVVIGGSLVGGSATQTGRIACDAGTGNIGAITIHGSIVGSSGQASGEIYSPNNITSLTIGGSMDGGSAQSAGSVFAAANLGAVSVTGSVVGGSAQSTGAILGNNVNSVYIGGDLIGTNFSSTTSVDHTASIRGTVNLNSVTIGGSVIAGAETGGGTLSFSGSIQAGQTLGTVKILGGVEGTSGNEVIISGGGLAAPTKHTQDPAIKSVSIGKTADYMRVMGGYSTAGTPVGGDAQIGSVTVGGDLIASDIVAGVKSSDAYFGNSGDTIIPTPATALTDGIYSTIGSIVVGGQVEGSSNASASFGIEAQLIGAMKIDGVALPLTKGPGNDGFYLGGTTGHDVHVRELLQS